MSFPSIICNEPPPLDSTSEEDDSDEFTAPGLNLDLSAETTPSNTPRKSAKIPSSALLSQHISNSPGATNSAVLIHTSEDEDDFRDCQEEYKEPDITKELQIQEITSQQVLESSENSDRSDNDGQLASDDQVVSKNFEESFQDFSAKTNAVSDKVLEAETKIVENHINQNEDEEEQDFDKGFSSDIIERISPEVVETSSTEQSNQSLNVIEEPSDFDDFEGFQSSNNFNSFQEDKTVISEMKTSYIGAVAVTDVHNEEDDDFGDFANFQSSSPPNHQALKVEDGFADFQAFKEAPVATPSTNLQTSSVFNVPTAFSIESPRSSADFTAALDSKFDVLIKTLIPNMEPIIQRPTSEDNLTLLENELKGSKDNYWSHTVDFEESRALLYKWLNSSCQQRLYRSLNIDTSTIVYTEKWGAIEVPRFAASMVESPILQPQVCSSPSISSRQSEASNPQERKDSSPDDNSNPKQPTLSIEVQQVIQRLPDISYMTSKTLVFPQAASSNNNNNNSLL